MPFEFPPEIVLDVQILRGNILIEQSQTETFCNYFIKYERINLATTLNK